MADVTWIKLATDMFDNRKIKHLRRLPDGDGIVLIWVMLLTLAGRCNSNGLIYLTESIPYTPKMLADELDFEESTINLALQALEQLGMVAFNTDGYLAITGWEDHQNIEGMDKIREQNRIRKAKYDKKKKALLPSNVTSNVTVTQSNAIDKDIDKNKNKKKEISIYSEVPELNDAILSFLEYRKKIKRPMTDNAIELMMSKLNDLSSDVNEQIEIINQSIMNGWQGVFPLKHREEKHNSIYQKQTKAEELDDFYKMAREWVENG